MTGEDNWQTKLQTVVERTTFMFNNELLSDVKFFVPVSNGEGEASFNQIEQNRAELSCVERNKLNCIE